MQDEALRLSRTGAVTVRTHCSTYLYRLYLYSLHGYLRLYCS